MRWKLYLSRQIVSWCNWASLNNVIMSFLFGVSDYVGELFSLALRCHIVALRSVLRLLLWGTARSLCLLLNGWTGTWVIGMVLASYYDFCLNVLRNGICWILWLWTSGIFDSEGCFLKWCLNGFLQSLTEEVATFWKLAAPLFFEES